MRNPSALTLPALGRGLLVAAASVLLALGASGAQATALSLPSYGALSSAERAKIPNDLRGAILTRALPPAHTWARDMPSPAGSAFPTVRYVKALVFCGCPDPDMADLRQAVLRAGGTVYMRYLSVRGLSVMLPATGVLEIARRPERCRASPRTG